MIYHNKIPLEKEIKHLMVVFMKMNYYPIIIQVINDINDELQKPNIINNTICNNKIETNNNE